MGLVAILQPELRFFPASDSDKVLMVGKGTLMLHVGLPRCDSGAFFWVVYLEKKAGSRSDAEHYSEL
jgi:hypothetical protein